MSAPAPVPLFRLVYQSQATLTLRPSALASLLEKSRANNHHLLLTGLLLYTDEQFMQVLEGPEPGLSQLYERISADPRHTDIRTLYYAPIERRAFPDWRMGFAQPTGSELRQTTGFLELTATPGLAAHPPQELWEQLRDFARGPQTS